MMTLVETWLSGNLAFALVAWMLLYTTDYYLSVLASRMYHAGVQRVLVHEGGIELTPQFRQDIDQQRWFSPRWLANLLLTAALLTAVWYIVQAAFGDRRLFDLVVGGFVLLEVSIHTRHLRVIALYRRILQGRGPTGQVVYPRWLSLDQSAVELGAFALMYLVIFGFTLNVHVLGGVLYCGVLALRHSLWSRRALQANNQ